MAAILLIIGLKLSKRKEVIKPKDDPTPLSRESSWRLRWFIVSGDHSVKPFEWIVQSFPESISIKIRELFDNKLYLYRDRVTFDCETDLAENSTSLDVVNSKIASYAPIDKVNDYHSAMTELDNCVLSQYNDVIDNRYDQCNEYFDKCQSIIDRVVVMSQE